MYKQAVILLTFLAYSLTLVHSLVPHHHHEEADTPGGHHHHHEDGGDHHHHEDNNKSLSHAFSDAVHHPASEVLPHASQSENFQKNSKTSQPAVMELKDVINVWLKPPDQHVIYTDKPYFSDPYLFFLLRAPPAS